MTLVLTFFTWGEVFSLFPSIVGDYYGTRCATVELRRDVFGEGRRLDHRRRAAALLFERFGTWTACFYGSAVLALLAAGLILGMKFTSASARAPMPVPATAK